MQSNSPLAQHRLHHLYAHGLQGINAGLRTSRLSSGYRPGRRRLSTTKARTTAISRTDPHVDLVCASNRAEWDDIIGAPAQEYEVALGLREYDVVALDANSMYAQKCFVDLVKHSENNLETSRIVLV